MSLPYVRLELGMPSHKKIRRLARRLQIEIYAAVGIVVMLWDLTATHYERGELNGVDPYDIADAVGWSGDAGRLYGALIDEHIIEAEEGGLRVRGWAERYQRIFDERDRKRKDRGKTSADKPPSSADDRPAFSASADKGSSSADKSQSSAENGPVSGYTREEKSIQEKTIQEPPPNPPEGGRLFGEDDPKKIDWQAVIVRWNELANANGRPKVYSLNDARKKKYRARLKATPNFWEILERELPLLGELARSSTSWCTFPWLLQSQENLDKLAEGNYREKKTGGPTRSAEEKVWDGLSPAEREMYEKQARREEEKKLASQKAKGESDGPEAKTERKPEEAEEERQRASGSPAPDA